MFACLFFLTIGWRHHKSKISTDPWTKSPLLFLSYYSPDIYLQKSFLFSVLFGIMNFKWGKRPVVSVHCIASLLHKDLLNKGPCWIPATFTFQHVRLFAFISTSCFLSCPPVIINNRVGESHLHPLPLSNKRILVTSKPWWHLARYQQIAEFQLKWHYYKSFIKGFRLSHSVWFLPLLALAQGYRVTHSKKHCL